MEETLNLSIWDGEHQIPTTRISKECGIISNSAPDIQSYVLSHCLFGDPKTIKVLPSFFFQATGNVVDNTHPFDIIQTALHLMICGNITMEIKGERSYYRDSCVLYPWGTTHLRQILHFPLKRLDIRGKEACGALLANGHFSQTSVDTSTNSITNHSFLHNAYIQKVYDHWKPLIVSLFLWAMKDDVNYIAPIRDIRKEIDQLMMLMCNHGMKEPPPNDKKLTSNGFFTYKVPREDDYDDDHDKYIKKGREKMKTIHLPEKMAPDVPFTLGNYDVRLPWQSESSHITNEKDCGQITVRRLYGENATFLLNCWNLVKSSTFKDIFEGLFALLCGKIYPRALTFRVGSPPPSLLGKAKQIEMEMEEEEERNKEAIGEYPGEIFYHY